MDRSLGASALKEVESAERSQYSERDKALLMDMQSMINNSLNNTETLMNMGRIINRDLMTEVTHLRKLLQEKDKKIESLSHRVTELECKCDDLEQYSRRNSLRINGIPEKDDEDPYEIVLKLANEVIEVYPLLLRMTLTGHIELNWLKEERTSPVRYS